MNSPLPSFSETLRFWFKLGWMSFGGPTAQIAMMHEEVVERRRWVSEEEFLRGLNFCMMLPGPEAQQLATYLGWRLHGTKGAWTAGILFVLPAVFILWGLSWIYAVWGSLPKVTAIFHGLEMAVMALIVIAMWKMGGKVLKSKLSWTLAAGGLGVALFGQINFLWWVGVLLLISFFWSWRVEDDFRMRGGFLSQDLRSPLTKIVGGFLIGFLPILVVGGVWGWDCLWFKLGCFFTKVAMVTFGGAYSILPYVAQQAVDHYHWLTPAQMMGGMALAETTPGPLIMVLQFVGFMAGWQDHQEWSPILSGTMGALVTTWATFFPSFLFILVLGPFLERIYSIPMWDRFLKWISAVVIGVMAAMAFGFARHLFGPEIDVNLLKIAGIGIGVVGISRWKWSPIVTIAGFAVLGWWIG